MVQVQQAEKATSRPRTKVLESIVDLPEQPTKDYQQAGDHLTELLSQAENAYQLYRQAQHEVARGYKKHEHQMEKLFKDAEKRANDAYEKALAQAVSTREQAKQEAEEASRTAQARAEEAFQRGVQEAQRDQRNSVARAWQKCIESREQAWGVFQGEKKAEAGSD